MLPIGGSALCLVPLLTAQQPALRDLDAPGAHRTARSGEGVRAKVFGSELELPARDRRSVAAWEAGLDLAPGANDGTAVPLGTVYFWERPDDGRLLRASLAGVANEVFYARTRADGAEWVATFDSLTLPWSTGELVDGAVDDREKLKWGYVRSGFGVGYRTQVAPYQQENMFASDLIIEPGLLYFARGDTTDPGYQLPESTFEVRLRWQTRWDAMERNLLELPHAGFAAGADAVAGFRSAAGAWGLPANGLQSGQRRYGSASAFWFGIGDVPGIDCDRHRLLASVHVGVGDGLDRFSATRVGGGPDLRGEEFATSARPWLPGAGYSEFFPEHYAVGCLGYRYELAFFAFVDVGGAVAWLDRDRVEGGGVEHHNDSLTAVSARLCTGFLGNTRMMLGYGHGFDVVRDGHRGADEVVLLVTGRF